MRHGHDRGRRDGDRLDTIAGAAYGDAEFWWRIADANRAMIPSELTSEIGRRLRITLPEGMNLAEQLGVISKASGIPLAELQKAAKDPSKLGLPSWAKPLPPGGGEAERHPRAEVHSDDQGARHPERRERPLDGLAPGGEAEARLARPARPPDAARCFSTSSSTVCAPATSELSARSATAATNRLMFTMA